MSCELLLYRGRVKRLSWEELKKSTGKEGKRALLSVDGKVYDVTSSRLWRNGKHMNSHLAGNDLSEEIQVAPHGYEVLERVELVGEIDQTSVGPNRDDQTRPPEAVASFLSLHPHPISVHFPIALSVTAALFTLLNLFYNNESLQTAAFYNLCCAALALPVSIFTGLLSQRFNYGGRWNRFLRWKFRLSLLFAALLATALSIRIVILKSTNIEGPWFWVYTSIVIGLAPVVASIGYLGGRITFPR